MTDLVAFHRARLDEDEAAARAATSGPWRYDPAKEWRDPDRPFSGEGSVFAGPDGWDATTICSTGPSDDPQSMADARHIARWDPARVLAEVAAKRAIVDIYEKERREAADRLRCGGMPGYGRKLIEGCLLALTQPYAEHPDFDPAWRVE